MIIYIPIWLDLLYGITLTATEDDTNLHSNMVRFIISKRRNGAIKSIKFTFQYG